MNSDIPEILIVEDEEDHARLIKKSLFVDGRLSNEHKWFKNGQEATDYIFNKIKSDNDLDKLPGLILLDVKLPIKNGFEVLQEVKSNPLTKLIPVVMLTTTSESEDIKRALNLGANDYIVKPVKFTDFKEKVNSLGNYWTLISDSKKSSSCN